MMKNYFYQQTSQRGFIAFITMLIIGSVVVIVTLSVGMQGIGGLKNTVSFTRSAQVSAGARGCIELALLRLRYHSTYLGENMELGETSCVIQIINLGANRYQINAESTSVGTPQYKHSIQVTILRRDFSLNVVNWQES